MRSPAALIVAAIATLVILQPQSAAAAWTASAAGAAPAAATSVNRAAAPTVTQTGSATVRLDWSAVTLGQGTPVTDYAVLRHTGSTTSQICTTVAPTRTCTDSAPVQGAVQYGVVAKYRSWTGQESPLTAFSLDVAPPVTTLSSSPAPNGAGWNNGAVTITLTAADNAGVSGIAYRVGAGSPVTVTGSSTSFPVSSQGSTAISYYATDSFGNVETTRSYTVRIDTSAPAAPVINAISSDTGTANDRITNVAAQTLSGTAEAGATVTVSRGATTYPSVVASASGSYSVPVTLVAGANSFTAVAVDPAGNTSPAASGFSVTLDAVLPTLTITDPKNGVAYKDGSGPANTRWANTCAGSPGACGTSSDSGSGVASVTVSLKDNALNTCWTGSGSTFSPCGAPLAVTGTTSWSKAIAYAVVVGRSSVQLTVTVTDVAGNVATGSVTFSAS